jgi:sterol desaturase/sphingolipid hydroxylase (fatty acid hydroxylase superfamily)
MDILVGQGDWLIRLAVFAGVFLVMALIELLWPKRKLMVSKRKRWLTNLGISVTGTLLLWLLRLMSVLAVPVAAIAAAFYAETHQIGLLNQVAWPAWVKLTIALVVLDLAIWAQHLASHKIPLLWRLHQVHHADRDIDVTTAVRFHPIEIGLSMLWKIVVVVPLGASPFSVFLFEVILNACAMFNHANIALPQWLDRIVRLFIVTPDMHRVHHSVLRREHDSNYGFNLSIWDRLFRTYTAQPEAGHQGMTIGLNPYQSTAPTRFGWSLWLPFGRQPRGDRTPEQ